MIFGVPARRDAVGSGADDPDGILNQALARVRDAVGDETVVMADLCLDEFTDHGHCGVLSERTRGGRTDLVVDNDATLERYAAMGLAQARAGAHVLGLSGMMDGQVGHCLLYTSMCIRDRCSGTPGRGCASCRRARSPSRAPTGC